MCLFQGILAGYYQPGQVGVKVGHIEFLKDTSSELSLAVVCDETFCEIRPGKYTVCLLS